MVLTSEQVAEHQFNTLRGVAAFVESRMRDVVPKNLGWPWERMRGWVVTLGHLATMTSRTFETTGGASCLCNWHGHVHRHLHSDD